VAPLAPSRGRAPSCALAHTTSHTVGCKPATHTRSTRTHRVVRPLSRSCLEESPHTSTHNWCARHLWRYPQPQPHMPCHPDHSCTLPNPNCNLESYVHERQLFAVHQAACRASLPPIPPQKTIAQQSSPLSKTPHLPALPGGPADASSLWSCSSMYLRLRAVKAGRQAGRQDSQSVRQAGRQACFSDDCVLLTYSIAASRHTLQSFANSPALITHPLIHDHTSRLL
jgi:hypothetical protein